MMNIKVLPRDAVGFFCDSFSGGGGTQIFEAASDEAQDIVISIGVSVDCTPIVYVEQYGVILEATKLASIGELPDELTKVYQYWLDFDGDSDEEEEPDEEIGDYEEDFSESAEDTIQENENGLDDAVDAFVEAVVGESLLGNGDWELLEKIKDHFCEYLAHECDLNVYRPMYLEDDDGNISFSEFPYEEI